MQRTNLIPVVNSFSWPSQTEHDPNLNRRLRASRTSPLLPNNSIYSNKETESTPISTWSSAEFATAFRRRLDGFSSGKVRYEINSRKTCSIPYTTRSWKMRRSCSCLGSPPTSPTRGIPFRTPWMSSKMHRRCSKKTQSKLIYDSLAVYERLQENESRQPE